MGDGSSASVPDIEILDVSFTTLQTALHDAYVYLKEDLFIHPIRSPALVQRVITSLFKLEPSKIHRLSIPNGESLPPLTFEHSEVESPTMDYSAALGYLATSPDGKWIAHGALDGKLRVWDLTTNRFFRIFDTSLTRIAQVAWSPDSKSILITGMGVNDVHARILHIADDRSVPLEALGGDKRLAWSPDGRSLTCMDHSYKRFDAVTGKISEEKVFAVRANQHLLRTLNNDRSKFLFGNRIFDAETGKLERDDTGKPGERIAFASDGNWDAYRVGESELHIVPRAFDRDTIVIKPHRFSNLWRTQPHGTLLAHADDNAVRLWDPTDGTQFAKLLHPAHVWSLEWSPSGKELASLADDQVLRIWDVEKQAIVEEYSKWPYAIDLSGQHDGRHLMTWGDLNARTLLISAGPTYVRLNRANTTPHEGFRPVEGTVNSLAVSPNGARVYLHAGYSSGWFAF